MACDMPEPCKFLSRDNCQKRFQWTHKEDNLAPQPVVGLVLQVGDTEKLPRALGFESLDPFFFSVSKQGPCFTAVEEGGGDIQTPTCRPVNLSNTWTPPSHFCRTLCQWAVRFLSW